jgi:circadian clock protein KaiB
MMTAKLRLYVSRAVFGNDPSMVRLRSILDRALGPYELEVLDILEHPRLACEDLVATTPTLLHLTPGPVRRVCGDLSDADNVTRGLGIASVSP